MVAGDGCRRRDRDSAVAGCPVWWGNDWSEPSILTWVGGVVGMALIVWLAVLSRCLWQAGHEVHAALVTGLVLPLTSHLGEALGRRGPDLAASTFYGALDRYLGGYLGLAVLVTLFVLALVHTIGRKSSWKYFRTFGPGRKQDAASEATSGAA